MVEVETRHKETLLAERATAAAALESAETDRAAAESGLKQELADARWAHEAAELKLKAFETRHTAEISEIQSAAHSATRTAQAAADDTITQFRDAAAVARAELAEAREQQMHAHTRAEGAAVERLASEAAQRALSERADAAEARLLAEVERANAANERVVVEVERAAAAGKHALAEAQRADMAETRLDHNERELRAAREQLQELLSQLQLLSHLKSTSVVPLPQGDGGVRAPPPSSVPAPADGEQATLLDVQVQHQLALARAERAERHAAALESHSVRALAEVEAVALEEEQKARLAEQRRLVAEKHLEALEARSTQGLAASEARAAEAIAALEVKLRASDERIRELEGRIPQLEADARKADTLAKTEAAARELVQARAEASESRLGRMQASQLVRQRGRAADKQRALRAVSACVPAASTNAHGGRNERALACDASVGARSSLGFTS
jgi:hypothetical protein